MNLNIDGAERLFLVQLLAHHLKSQVPLVNTPMLNSHGNNPALALFEKLQPEGSSVGTSIGDWVESRVDGKFYEVVLSKSPSGKVEADDESIMAVMPSADVFWQEGCAITLEECEYIQIPLEDIKLPSKLSVEEAVESFSVVNNFLKMADKLIA